MQAADPPAIIAPSDDSSIIEVVATRPDQAQKIDRRIFRVKDNPHAAQSDTLQLLRGLPAVVVTPDDRLLLLGSPGVTILVDERPVQGDPIQYLRTLHGSDIERIEIITNPSAQYAAQGSGGIINIVLRRKRADGVSGSASILASSLGRAEGSTTIKTKHGKWSYEVQAQSNGGRVAASTFHKLRTVERPDGRISINSADGDASSRILSGYVSGRATVDLTPRTSVSAQFSVGANHFRSSSATAYVGRSSDFLTFFESVTSPSNSSFRNISFTFDRKGKVEGETLKASANLFAVNSSPRAVGSYDNGGGYLNDLMADQTYAGGRIDWTHPIGKTRIFSSGASVDRGTSDRHLHFTSAGAQSAPLLISTDAFGTRDTTVAAYATYQLQTGKWTLLPGIRLEHFDRAVTSPSRTTVSIHKTSLFPTFHLDRPLGKEITLSLSFAKRTNRPDPTQLRPYAQLTGALAFVRGNPNLRDQTTDNYELDLHYHHKKVDLGAILYDRETAHLIENSYYLDFAGNNITTFINSGHKSDRGAEFDLTLPLMRRVKGTASVNLFNSVVPLDPFFGASSFSQFRYTANTTLDWQGKDRGSGNKSRPGDIGELQLVYASPSRTFQFRNSATASGNLSFTHSFSHTLAITGSLDGIGAGHSSHRLVAPTVQEDYDQWTRQPEFKIKLVKTLSKMP